MVESVYYQKKIEDMQEEADYIYKKFRLADAEYKNAVDNIRNRQKDLTDPEKERITNLSNIRSQLKAEKDASAARLKTYMEAVIRTGSYTEAQARHKDAGKELGFLNRLTGAMEKIARTVREAASSIDIPEAVQKAEEGASVLLMRIRELRIKINLLRLDDTAECHRKAIDYAYLRARIAKEDRDLIYSLVSVSAPRKSKTMPSIGDRIRIWQLERKSDRLLIDLKELMLKLNESRIRFGLPEVRTESYPTLLRFKDKTAGWNEEFRKASRELRKETRELSAKAKATFTDFDPLLKEFADELEKEAREPDAEWQEAVTNDNRKNEKAKTQMSPAARKVFGLDRNDTQKEHQPTPQGARLEAKRAVSLAMENLKSLSDPEDPEKVSEICWDVYCTTADFLKRGGTFRAMLRIVMSCTETDEETRSDNNMNLCATPALKTFVPGVYSAALRACREKVTENVSTDETDRLIEKISSGLKEHIIAHKHVSDSDVLTYVESLTGLLVKHGKNPDMLDYIDTRLHMAQYDEQRIYAAEKKWAQITDVRPKDMFFSEQNIRGLFRAALLLPYYSERTGETQKADKSMPSKRTSRGEPPSQAVPAHTEKC